MIKFKQNNMGFHIEAERDDKSTQVQNDVQIKLTEQQKMVIETEGYEARLYNMKDKKPFKLWFR